MSIQQLLETIASRAAGGASVKNVYGNPVTVGPRTVIPVAEIRYAFGGGGGSPKADSDVSGGGGGGRGIARPHGALEVTPEGTRYIFFDDRRRTVAALALGFVLGAAIVALTGPRRIEVVKRTE
jgi:uncharacterized spore protein YtfJ